MKYIFIILMMFVTSFTWSQHQYLFHENFEGANHQMISSTHNDSTPDWVINSSLQSSGYNCIYLYARNLPEDTLEGYSISTPKVYYSSAFTNYYLTFKHIAKIHQFDYARIEVRNFSTSGDSTQWKKVIFSDTSDCYLGTSQLITGGEFDALCYNTWAHSAYNLPPSNDWWKAESIDITEFLTDTITYQCFQVRFVYKNVYTNPFSLAWYVDDISIAYYPNLSVNDNSKINYNIYPNPTSDKFIIENSENIKSIYIFQIDGRLIRNIPVNESPIDISDLKPGVYIVKVTEKDNRNIIKKIVKK